jgi:hypothetical protein
MKKSLIPWTREQVLARYSELDKTKTNTFGGVQRIKGFYPAIRHYFGGINNLRRELGLDVNPYQYRPTNSQLLKELLRITHLLGRKPTHQDIAEHSKYSISSYKRHFGGLEKAYWLASSCAGIKGKSFTVPSNENGVRVVFGLLCDTLGFELIHIGERPDAIVSNMSDGRKLKVEFEFRSSDFDKHGHDTQLCDVLVCWEHDWKECPIEAVVPLKQLIQLAGEI